MRMLRTWAAPHVSMSRRPAARASSTSSQGGCPVAQAGNAAAEPTTSVTRRTPRSCRAWAIAALFSLRWRITSGIAPCPARVAPCRIPSGSSAAASTAIRLLPKVEGHGQASRHGIGGDGQHLRPQFLPGGRQPLRRAHGDDQAAARRGERGHPIGLAWAAWKGQPTTATRRDAAIWPPPAWPQPSARDCLRPRPTDRPRPSAPPPTRQPLPHGPPAAQPRTG